MNEYVFYTLIEFLILTFRLVRFRYLLPGSERTSMLTNTRLNPAWVTVISTPTQHYRELIIFLLTIFFQKFVKNKFIDNAQIIKFVNWNKKMYLNKADVSVQQNNFLSAVYKKLITMCQFKHTLVYSANIQHFLMTMYVWSRCTL